MFTREPERSARPLLDPQQCLECPMCHTAISADSIAGVCSSCPLYRMKNGCCIDLIACPQCGSTNTAEISRFGSTACKALYRCNDCSEPFDHVKEL